MLNCSGDSLKIFNLYLLQRKASEPTCSSTEDNEPLPDCKLKHAMPEKLAQIFCKCLDEDPKQRPSLDDVVLVLIRLQ